MFMSSIFVKNPDEVQENLSTGVTLLYTDWRNAKAILPDGDAQTKPNMYHHYVAIR
jgi:hypothetical protein